MCTAPSRAATQSLSAALLSVLPMAGASGQWSPPPNPSFQFYWGVLTQEQALPTGVTFEDDPYGLASTPINTNMVFLVANKVGIYPEPGPHEIGMTPGYMEAHLADLRVDLDRWVPDPAFDGPVVIDYEDWYLNWERTKNVPSTEGPLAEDTDFLQDWEDYIREYRPEVLDGVKEDEVLFALQASYEAAALDFFMVTLAECKRLRPDAQWGFYNYPPKRYYSTEVPRTTPRTIAYGNHTHFASELNDRLAPLWEASDALFPSTYANRVTVADGVTPDRNNYQNNIADDRLYIRSIIEEAHRLAAGKPVYNVVWSRYQNCGDMSNQLLNDVNIQNQREASYEAGANGTILWDGIMYRSEFNELTTWLHSEFLPPNESATPIYAVSFASPVTVPNLGTFPGEDILVYDPSRSAWSVAFDGSDVGVGPLTIDAFAITPAGDILMSFTADATVPGLVGGPSGTAVDDSDIVRFIPVTLGTVTAGTFSFYFDGSDVSLDAANNSEDIDAIALDPASGDIIISTLGSTNIVVPNGQDEDLFRFHPTSLGAATAGTWSLHFDGSDVGLATTADDDIDAVALLPGGDVCISTFSNGLLSGLIATDEDILRFTPTSLGSTTTGSYSLLSSLTGLGIGAGMNLNGLDITTSNVLHISQASEAPDAYCPADIDGDGILSEVDLFGFLVEFFEGDADFDGSGATDSNDLLEYQVRFAEGCL